MISLHKFCCRQHNVAVWNFNGANSYTKLLTLILEKYVVIIMVINNQKFRVNDQLVNMLYGTICQC